MLEVIAQAVGYTLEGVTGGKKAGKFFYIILVLVVIGLLVFTLLMS